MQPRRVGITRSSEYKNLRHVVPSLRRQRDIGKVEVVTEAARYIDHLHKTLIERFVLCGIPDSLKDVLGTNDTSELGSQHIMNLVTRMAASQRQQEQEQQQARQIRRQQKQQSPPLLQHTCTATRPMIAPISARDSMKSNTIKRTHSRKDAHRLRITKKKTKKTSSTTMMRQHQQLLAPNMATFSRFGGKSNAAPAATMAVPTTDTTRTTAATTKLTSTTNTPTSSPKQLFCNNNNNYLYSHQDNSVFKSCTYTSQTPTTPLPPMLPPVVAQTNNVNINHTMTTTDLERSSPVELNGTETNEVDSISGNLISDENDNNKKNDEDDDERESKEPHD